MKTPKLNNGMTQILQALRAAPMDSSQIAERFGSVSTYLSSLIRFGYVIYYSGFYKITPEGRFACPNRRDMPAIPLHETSDSLKKERDQKYRQSQKQEKYEMAEANKKFKAVALVKKVIDVPGITQEAMMNEYCGVDKSARKRLYQMLKYCTDNGFLEAKGNDELVVGNNELWLAQHGLLDATKGGVTASGDVQQSSASSSESAAMPAAQSEEETTSQPLLIGIDPGKGDIGFVREVDASLRITDAEVVQDFEIPAFLHKDNQPKLTKELAESLVDIGERIVSDAPKRNLLPDVTLEAVKQEIEHAKAKIKRPRFAITSDRTLMIFGLQEQPIELDAEATAALDEFFGEIFLVEHENRAGRGL